MTLLEARDAMFDIFFTGVWQATGYIVKWPDMAEVKPPLDEPWARVTVQHNLGGQASLSGDAGSKRWERAGVLTIQLFAPVGTGLKEAYNRAQAVVNTYEGSSSGSLWFRNVRVVDAEGDGAFTQTNVVIDFEYDDVH